MSIFGNDNNCSTISVYPLYTAKTNGVLLKDCF